MIHAFNFTCNRDLELSLLMVNTFTKHCPSGSISVTNTDTTPAYKDYGNGSGWQASMMKLKALTDIVKTKNVQDGDFVLSIDSDVVFCSPEVFNYANTQYGIIGTKHIPEFYTMLGSWSHMSGALIFIRGDIARKMSELSGVTLDMIRAKHFKGYNITENEDVVLSYLASYVGAKQFALPGNLSSGDFEIDVFTDHFDKRPGSGPFKKSFYHLNYCPTQFLREPVTGKWDIPKVLEMKGIEL